MTTQEQRKEIQRLSMLNCSCASIGEQLNLSVSTVKKWRARLKKGVRLKVLWVVQSAAR